MAISVLDRQRVRERARFRCEYCHADERWQFVKFTVDHVVPRSQGGGDEAANLALACRNCNERRGNRCVALDPDTGQPVPVFKLMGAMATFAWPSLRPTYRPSRPAPIAACSHCSLLPLQPVDARWASDYLHGRSPSGVVRP